MMVALICIICLIELFGCIGVFIYTFSDGIPCNTPLEYFYYLIVEPIEEWYTSFNVVGTIIISIAVGLLCFLGIVITLVINYCILLPIWAFCKLFGLLFGRKY